MSCHRMKRVGEKTNGVTHTVAKEAFRARFLRTQPGMRRATGITTGFATIWASGSSWSPESGASDKRTCRNAEAAHANTFREGTS